MKEINNLTIQLKVNDVSKSAKFYTEVLGFHVTDNWKDEGLDSENLPEGFWTTLLYHQNGDNLIVHMTLQQNSEPAATNLGGKIVFELEQEDLEKRFETMKQQEVKVIKELSIQKFKAGDSPETVKDYKYHYFTIEDLDGFRWNFRTKDELDE